MKKKPINIQYVSLTGDMYKKCFHVYYPKFVIYSKSYRATYQLYLEYWQQWMYACICYFCKIYHNVWEMTVCLPQGYTCTNNDWQGGNWAGPWWGKPTTIHDKAVLWNGIMQITPRLICLSHWWLQKLKITSHPKFP